MDKNRIWLLVGAVVIVCVCMAMSGGVAAYFVLGRPAEDVDTEAAENVFPPSQFDEQDDNVSADALEDIDTEAVEDTSPSSQPDNSASTGDFTDQFPIKGDLGAPVTITEFSDYG